MFGWDDAFILSMQAAGAIINIKSAKDSQKLMQMGRQLEKESIETSLSTLNAQAADQSAQAMTQLRENIANQIVLNAARGSSSGAGSGQAGIQKAEGIHAQDAQARRLNLLAKQGELKAQNVTSAFKVLESETKLGQSLTDQIFNMIPTTSLTKKFGSSAKNALEGIGTAVGGKFGFGLNTIGS
jgi:transcriptional regulator of heat shock response